MSVNNFIFCFFNKNNVVSINACDSFRVFKSINNTDKLTIKQFLIFLHGSAETLALLSNKQHIITSLFLSNKLSFRIYNIIELSNSSKPQNIFSNLNYIIHNNIPLNFLFNKTIHKYTSSGVVIFQNNYILLSKNFKSFINMKSVSITNTNLVSPKYVSSSISKFLSDKSINMMEFQFLRKNKVYNKGRYSRCRQNYRTGVYLCMYLSIVSIFGLYYWFYKFSFNFSYLWWFFFCFIGSFFFPKIVKYRLYEPVVLINKFFGFFKWCSAIIKSIVK